MLPIPCGRNRRNGSQSEVNELSHDLAHRYPTEGRAGLERAVKLIRDIERCSHICIFMRSSRNVKYGLPHRPAHFKLLNCIDIIT